MCAALSVWAFCPFDCRVLAHIHLRMHMHTHVRAHMHTLMHKHTHASRTLRRARTHSHVDTLWPGSRPGHLVSVQVMSINTSIHISRRMSIHMPIHMSMSMSIQSEGITRQFEFHSPSDDGEPGVPPHLACAHMYAHASMHSGPCAHPQSGYDACPMLLTRPRPRMGRGGMGRGGHGPWGHGPWWHGLWGSGPWRRWL